MYSQTTGVAVLRAPSGSQSRTESLVPSLSGVHSLSTTSTPRFFGSCQPLLSRPSASAGPIQATGTADRMAAERRSSRRESDMVILLVQPVDCELGHFASERITQTKPRLARVIDQLVRDERDIGEDGIHDTGHEHSSLVEEVCDVNAAS